MATNRYDWNMFGDYDPTGYEADRIKNYFKQRAFEAQQQVYGQLSGGPHPATPKEPSINPLLLLLED